MVRYFNVRGSWYEKYVSWAVEKQLIYGYDGSHFGPDDRITVEQAAALLWRYASYRGLNMPQRARLYGYTDAGEIDGWALDAMEWASAYGIYSGSGRRLSPRSAAARADLAMMIYNFSEAAGLD